MKMIFLSDTEYKLLMDAVEDYRKDLGYWEALTEFDVKELQTKLQSAPDITDDGVGVLRLGLHRVLRDGTIAEEVIADDLLYKLP